jgi:hypothetical protein|nr:MAG TPA: hypothetical protein [Caudoviricetes sp.]
MEQTAKQRVEKELQDLKEKRRKLDAFLRTDAYKALNDNMQSLLVEQQLVMSDYEEILERRLQIWED